MPLYSCCHGYVLDDAQMFMLFDIFYKLKTYPSIAAYEKFLSEIHHVFSRRIRKFFSLNFVTSGLLSRNLNLRPDFCGAAL